MTNTDPYKQSMKIILSQLTQYISTYRQSQLQKQTIFTSLQQKQNKTNIKQQDRISIQKYLRIFYYVLLNVGNQWIDLLINDGIQSETLIVKINNGVTLTKIYQNIVNKVNAQINKQCYQITANKDIKNNQIDFQQIFMNKTCKNMLTQILNNISKTIVQGFKYGKNTIIHYIKKIQKQIQKKQMMNPYIAFSLLKQVSVKVQKQIIQYLSKTIINIQSIKCMQFCKYIQKNYELVTLDYGETNYIYSKEELRLYTKEENDRWLQYIKNYMKNNIQVQHIQSLNGDTGILVSKKNIQQYQQTMDQMNNTQQQISKNKDKKKNKKQKKKDKDKDKDKDDQKLILKIQNGKQIKVLNAKICQNSWKIFQKKQDINQIYQVLRNQIQLTDNLKTKQYVSIGIPTCQYATIGGSLGKCLADIDKYNDANQFFVDLSKSAAISTTFSIAMAEIPILSYFIIAGGLSYSYYLACSNHATSSFRKANEVGSATFIAVGSIGSTVGGIILGQVVIPIPFLGAFVGGLIGGFIGTKTVTTINSLLQHSNFRDIITYMKSKIILQKYWKCTKYMLQRIGLDQKYFYKHTPAGQRNKDIYITAICFCIVTFYQSRRKKQFTQQKLKQYKEEQQKKQQNQQKSILNIFNKKKNQNKDKENQQKKQQKMQEKQTKEENETKKERQIKEQLFHNQFNIVKIIQFLTEQNFMILDHLDQLQNFICHIV